MKTIRLVIFDLDGTLVDAYPAIISSFNHTMKKLRYPLESDLTIRRAVGWGDRNLLKPFVRKHDLGRALALYRRHHKTALLQGARLFPGAREALVYVKEKGSHLAVASNRPSRFSHILIRHLKIDKYFDYVLCADKLKQGKPHPQILNSIMRKMGVSAAETIYVGDMVIDVQAGRRAGLRTIIVTTGSSPLAQLKRERPWRIMPGIAGLVKLL